MAIRRRQRDGADLTGLIHRSDRGARYRAIRYGPALSDCDVVVSAGPKGDSHDKCPGRGPQPPAQGRTDPWAAATPTPTAPGRASTTSSPPPPSGYTGRGHHPPPPRHRRAHRRRARGCPRSTHRYRRPDHLPPLAGNHRRQINQPPRNPGLDTTTTPETPSYVP